MNWYRIFLLIRIKTVILIRITPNFLESKENSMGLYGRVLIFSLASPQF